MSNLHGDRSNPHVTWRRFSSLALRRARATALKAMDGVGRRIVDRVTFSVASANQNR